MCNRTVFFLSLRINIIHLNALKKGKETRGNFRRFYRGKSFFVILLGGCSWEFWFYMFYKGWGSLVVYFPAFSR